MTKTRQCKIATGSECLKCWVCRDYVCTTCTHFVGDGHCGKGDRPTVQIGLTCSEYERQK